MLVNNELGTRQPVADVARLLGRVGDRKRPHLHVDAVQAFGLERLRPRSARRRQRRALRAQAARAPGRGRAVAPPGRPAGAALGRRRPGARPARRQREPARPRRVRGRGDARPRRGAGRRRGAGGGASRSVRAGGARRAGRRRARRPPHRDRRAPRPAHRLAGVPGPARRAAAARARSAWRARLGGLRLRVAHGRPQPDAQGHRDRRSHGRAPLLVFAPHHRRRRRRRRSPPSSTPRASCWLRARRAGRTAPP